jgi:GT2 family glycosyltransferase
MIQVAVSILNFNSSKSTIACVESLLNAGHQAQDLYVLDVFVTDNDSLAEEQSELEQSLDKFPSVQLHVNTENRGFAAGHNGNLRAIFRHSSPDYVWILNNDCLVNKDTLNSLIECARQRPAVGIWGATLLEPDGETIQCAGGCAYNSWISSYRQYGRGASLANIDQLEFENFDYIAGASMFFPVKVLQEDLCSVSERSIDDSSTSQQWLNERFFLYFEELDLAMRLKPGFGMAWCKAALIRHVGGESIGTSNSQRTAKAEYHSTLSALRFTHIYYPKRLWLTAPVRYISKCLQLSFKGEFQLIGPLTRAYLDFWRN